MHAHNLNATARFHCSHPAWKDEVITLLSPSLLLPTSPFPLPLSSPWPIEPRASRDAQNPTRRVALAYSWNNVMDQLQGGQPRIMIGARACGDRVCIWMVVTIGRLLAHGCVMVPLRVGAAMRAPLAVEHTRISALSIFFLSTQRWSKRRGCGQGGSDLVKDGFVEGAQVAACVTPMMPTQGRSQKRQIINRVNRQNQVQ